MARHNTLHPTPSLNSLPIELLNQIAQQCDRKTALSLARVARAFVAPAERRIWRELDLLLNPSYGIHPLVLPGGTSEAEQLAAAEAEAKAAEERHRQGLRDRVKQITRKGGGRLGMVEKVSMISRPGAVHAMLALLDIVSTQLEKLELRPPAPHVFESSWHPADFDTLDMRLVGYGLHFPALTHLVIHNRAVRYGETIILLCEASPNLVSLTVEMNHASVEMPRWDENIAPPPYDNSMPLIMSKLRQLSFSCCDRDDYQDDGYFHPLIAVVANSPQLRQLSIQYSSDDQELVAYIMSSISRMEYLVDLDWSITHEEFCENLNFEEPGFPSLRRLVLSSVDQYTLLERFPALPDIRTIHIVESHIPKSHCDPVTGAFPEPTRTCVMIPAFAKQLHVSPKLSVINWLPSLAPNHHLDIFEALNRFDASGKPTGILRSLVHGEGELLHFRLFFDFVEVADEKRSSQDTPRGCVKHRYLGRDGVEREKTYQVRPEAQWHDLVDFEGYKVPLEVIQRMRHVEGASLAAWEGRGIKVGARAWKVLTDWRDEQREREAAAVS